MKAIERMGVQNAVGVYGGANYPLYYDLSSIKTQQATNPNGWFGAWSYPEPHTIADLKPPPDGFAARAALQAEHAVDFLINTIKRYPHQVSILEVAPPTNLALALRKAPEIAPLVKQIIYMGGAMEAPGNTTAFAEFNWWFDPQAVSVVLHTDIQQIIIPLDVTNTVLLDKSTYDNIVHHPNKQTIVTKIYAHALTEHSNIHDTLTIAYLLDPTYATQAVEAWLDIDTSDGPNQGRVFVYKDAPRIGASSQKIKYVTRFDNARFLDLYVDLLTRPVPVILPEGFF